MKPVDIYVRICVHLLALTLLIYGARGLWGSDAGFFITGCWIMFISFIGNLGGK